MKDKLNATTAFDSSEAFRDRMFGCAPSSSGLSNPVLNMNERNYTVGRIRFYPMQGRTGMFGQRVYGSVRSPCWFDNGRRRVSMTFLLYLLLFLLRQTCVVPERRFGFFTTSWNTGFSSGNACPNLALVSESGFSHRCSPGLRMPFLWMKGVNNVQLDGFDTRKLEGFAGMATRHRFVLVGDILHFSRMEFTYSPMNTMMPKISYGYSAPKQG